MRQPPLNNTRPCMSFAKGIDHLDGDELPFDQFVLPRPNSSVLYRVKDDALATHAIVTGDRIVVERDRQLQANRIALVSSGGALRLVPIYREGARFTFEGASDEDALVIGIASRVIRILIP